MSRRAIVLLLGLLGAYGCRARGPADIEVPDAEQRSREGGTAQQPEDGPSSRTASPRRVDPRSRAALAALREFDPCVVALGAGPLSLVAAPAPETPSGSTDEGSVPLGPVHQILVGTDGAVLHYDRGEGLVVCPVRTEARAPLIGFWAEITTGKPGEDIGKFYTRSSWWLRSDGTFVRAYPDPGHWGHEWVITMGVWHPTDDGFLLSETFTGLGSGGSESFATENFEFYGDDPTCNARSPSRGTMTVSLGACEPEDGFSCRTFAGQPHYRVADQIDFREQFYRDLCE